MPDLPEPPEPPKQMDFVSVVGFGCLAVVLAVLGAYGGCATGLFLFEGNPILRETLPWPLFLITAAGAGVGLRIWWRMLKRRE